MQKEHIINLLNKMPEEVPIGDLIAELHFREKLNRGLKQIEDGKLISHKDAKQRLSKWLE